MQRRSFLRTAASVIPAAGLHDLITREAFAQTAASAPWNELHVVGKGEDRTGHPHPLGFSSLLFKVTATETGGVLFVVEHKNLTPGGPPLHLHLYQDEWFYVMEGAVDFQVGEQRVQLKAGESVLAPRRIPHSFSAVGPAPGHMMIAFCPAGKMEEYFRDSAGAPPPADPAAHFRRYDMEYLGPSPFLKDMPKAG